MGCGNSQVQKANKITPISGPDDASYEKIMDKNIPNYFIEDPANENYPTEEDGKVDQKSDDVVNSSFKHHYFFLFWF